MEKVLCAPGRGPVEHLGDVAHGQVPVLVEEDDVALEAAVDAMLVTRHHLRHIRTRRRSVTQTTLNASLIVFLIKLISKRHLVGGIRPIRRDFTRGRSDRGHVSYVSCGLAWKQTKTDGVF